MPKIIYSDSPSYSMSKTYIKVAKNNQHVDFPGGHPPEYYPRLTLLNFTDRTGCGAVNVIWPITLVLFSHCLDEQDLNTKCFFGRHLSK